ncbi:class I SAM-dependent methyltransferase [Marilutibacter alkalisoli]|uniref:Methyltransferase domain-containing protein n=1 Tax=Marilutibacter alkalisoli TaxID=2591633 RepID=A0A514BSG9_9GAMM|nr:methyltransferase domain-containing protein [Lysobacter alkalisoli]QDH70342.1 methyltransferase domain-containing protein [Lysobacter alkalisoli]
MNTPSKVPMPDEEGQQWDRVAAGWKKWWPTIENAARCVSKRMLELAEVEPGQRVLDIATGIGEPALLAASRVGPSGRVVATDISSRMLDIARERAAMSGVSNVEFRQADAGQLDFPDGSFDAVLCRWGVTSLPNPPDALAAIRRMLAPDGAFATAVWGAAADSRPLAGLATAVAREVFDLPAPRPQVPSLPGSAEDALEKMMIHAGFADVRTERIRLTLEWASTDECTQYVLDVSPELAALFLDRPSGQQVEYRQRLAERLRPYVIADGGVRIPNMTICAAGRR